MKTSVLRKTKQLEVVDIDLPVLKPNEVLVRVDCVGICGTDVSVYRGEYAVKENVVLGHEYNGTVAEIGSAVSLVKKNDYVASDASWGCGECHWCKYGLTSYCDKPNMLGRTIDGSLAEYIIVPEKVLHRIDRSVTSIEAQAVVGVATALRAKHRSGLKPGNSVLIIGPGYSGLIISQLCKLAGAKDVGMVGTRNSRLKIAEELGVDFTANISNSPDWEKEILKRTDNFGFDVCIEASGTVAGVLSSVRMVKKGGTIVQFGTSFNIIDGLPQKDFYTREISLIGSKGGFGCYQEAITLLEQKKLIIEPLITHRFPLEKVVDAFEVMDKRLDNVIRAAIFCS